jgi:hypothetical protein
MNANQSPVDQVDTTLSEALDFCRTLLATTPRDTSLDPVDALVCAVLIGYGCEEHLSDSAHVHDEICGGEDGSMTPLAEFHNWSPEVVAKLRRFRSAVVTVTGILTVTGYRTAHN